MDIHFLDDIGCQANANMYKTLFIQEHLRDRKKFLVWKDSPKLR